MSPPMRPPRKGVSHSEAIAAAYASAPEDEVILDTLEFQHPTFLDDVGAPMSIRVVNNTVNITATLEDDAPMNPGEAVLFRAVFFRFERPPEDDSGNLPELQLTVSNVSKILIPYVRLAKNDRVPITVNWRPYLASDLSGPHYLPVVSLSLRSVDADMTSMTARAGISDLGNRKFPGIEYTAASFPGLTAR